MNKIEVHPQIQEVKKIWLENREGLSTYAIWKKLVQEQYSFKSSDMYIFYQTVRRWEAEKAYNEVKKMTSRDIKKLEEENRKMTIIIINRQLKNGLKKYKNKKTSELMGSIFKLIKYTQDVQYSHMLLKTRYGRRRVKWPNY